jgi:hypothetical protein
MDLHCETNQDIDLPQLRDDLFGFVTFSRHGSDPPRCHKTYLKVDQFNGGGSSDATGRTLAHVYAAEGAVLSAVPHALTRDEARRIARLPELLAQMR